MSVSRAEGDLARLDAEMQRLRARIAAMEEQAVKLRHYIEVAREYEGAQPVVVSGSGVAPTLTVRAFAYAGGITRTAVDTTIAILRERGQPMHTRPLLDELTRRGIVVGGSNPVANLSGFLSRASDKLRNSRTYGWSLREWGEPGDDQPPSEATPESDAGSPAGEPAAEQAESAPQPDEGDGADQSSWPPASELRQAAE